MQVVQQMSSYAAAWRALPRGQKYILLVLGAGLLVAQIGQPFAETAWLHHVPTAFAILAAPVALRRWPLSTAAVAAIALFLALHTVGGRYIYSNVPYDDWSDCLVGVSLSEVFGWTRNHYDRLVHFSFGLLLFAPSTELLRRHAGLGLRGAIAGAFAINLAIGALYEIFEWLLTLAVPAQYADDYNGQQGDAWDAQKDMALALLGAGLAAIGLVITGTRIDRRD